MPKTPTSTDRPTEDTTWDGSPLTRYAWQKDLPRRLTRANPSYRTLCEYGYVLERSKVVCSSPSHRDNLFHNNVARSTFQNPCAIDQFTQINNKLTLTAVPLAADSRCCASSRRNSPSSRQRSAPGRLGKLPACN
mmetsp:Transcript_29095/g.66835  ORF Transcript_29095/g.66835 Transcript_29095/m.66835 type:complete len:135 (+) Transcript_29095:212-616(+)